MPQVRPFQQSLFPELSGTFQESESFTTLNQEAKHGSQQRIQHHSRQSRLHFGVDEVPSLSESARQGGDELLPKPPEGSGRSGIGGDDSLHTSGTGGPGGGDPRQGALDGPSTERGGGAGAGTDFPAVGVRRQ